MEKLMTWIAAERGRLTRLASECGITHSAVLQWPQVPAERVLDVERVTGISRHELRPDVFGPAEERAA
jgi:DNA-binding transcriptional regulator YdaS (Cro superfamily)